MEAGNKVAGNENNQGKMELNGPQNSVDFAKMSMCFDDVKSVFTN
jgi:hypothetical protein